MKADCQTPLTVTLPVTVRALIPRQHAERMLRGDLLDSLADALTIHGLELPLHAWGEQVGEVTAECAPAAGITALVCEPGMFPGPEPIGAGETLDAMQRCVDRLKADLAEFGAEQPAESEVGRGV